MFGLENGTTSATIVYVTIVVFCIGLAAMMSGLTLGLFSIDESFLKIMAESGTETERKYARRLQPLLANHHWLLVTLLLGNAAAVELMPLALNNLVSAAAAIILSVTLVLLFGEIIPQAIFVRYALVIGGNLAYPVKGLMYLTGPISWPVGKLLDAVVGHHGGVLYRRFQLKEFIKLQVELAKEKDSSNDGGSEADALQANLTGSKVLDASSSSDDSDTEALSPPEVKLMLGALSLSEGTAATAMKQGIDDVFSIPLSGRVDEEMVEKIFLSGYSRIMVYDGSPTNITGYVIAKTLLLLIYTKPDDAPLVKDLTIRKPLIARESDALHTLYSRFQTGEAHIAVVVNRGGEALGIVTVEDVMEVLHQTQFEDETDLASQQPVQMLMKQWKGIRKINRRIERVEHGDGKWSPQHRKSTPVNAYRKSSPVDGYRTVSPRRSHVEPKSANSFAVRSTLTSSSLRRSAGREAERPNYGATVTI